MSQIIRFGPFPLPLSSHKHHPFLPRFSTLKSKLSSTQQPAWSFRLTNQIMSLLKPFLSPPIMPREKSKPLTGFPDLTWSGPCLPPSSNLPGAPPSCVQSSPSLSPIPSDLLWSPTRETSHPATLCHISFSILGKTLIKSILVLSF